MADEDLIAAARAGQEHAGPFLVSSYGPKLNGFCRTIARDLSDVDREHVVETAIETAVRRIDRFDPERGTFEAWLRAFVRHSAQDWRRSSLRTSSLDAANEGGIALGDTLAAVAGLAPDNAGTTDRPTPLVEAVRDALPKLTVPDQVIIALRDFENRSVDEVAEILEIRRDACRQRHHRAKVRLRKLLEKDPRTASAILIGDPE